MQVVAIKVPYDVRAGLIPAASNNNLSAHTLVGDKGVSTRLTDSFACESWRRQIEIAFKSASTLEGTKSELARSRAARVHTGPHLRVT